MKEKVVRFKGNEYLLIDGCSITTTEAFSRGECSFAHLFEDGTIKRFGETIGHRSDLVEVGECEVELQSTWLDGLLGDTWIQGG